MLDTETKRRIDTARDILVGKLPDPKGQVEQITIALTYKFMDDMDARSEELGGERTFFDGDFQKYGWARLIRGGLGGHEMLGLYSEAITKMPENPGIPPLFRDIFKNAYLPYRDPETLRAFLKVIDEFEYDHSERLGDAFEYLLSVLGSQGDAGQFRTPRHIIDFIVSIVDPKKDETVLDPACGTAGFLISSYKHVLQANADRDGNSTLTPDDRQRLADNFRGYDISPDMVRLSLVNMYLHGFPDPQVHEYDTLTSEDRWNERADVILANPPFMSPKGGIRPHNRFSVQSSRSEVLFVDYIAEHLTANGRAGVIVPEGIVFQTQTAYRQLRRMLLSDSLIAVISLPGGVFNPYSGVKTSVLVLDKALATRSDDIAFFTVDNDGLGLGAQRRPIDRNDLPQVLAEVREFMRRIRERDAIDDYSPAFGHVVSKELILRDPECTLSGARYRTVGARSSQYPVVSLGEVAEVIAGQSPPGESYNETGTGLPFYQGKVAFGPVFLGPPLRWTTEPQRVAEPGDILMSVRAPVGPVNVTNHRICIGRGLAAIRPDAGRLVPEFGFYVLRSIENQITGNLGAAFASINRADIEKIEIPLPPLHVQQELVNELRDYQRLIDGARAIVDHYRPRIPVDYRWPVVRVGNADLFAIESGGTPRTDVAEYWGGSIPWATLIDLPSSDFVSQITSTARTLTERGLAESSATLLPEGTVVVSTRATIGRVGIARVPLATNQGFKNVIIRDSVEVNRAYVAFALKNLVPTMVAWATGGTFKELSRAKFAELEIPLPPIEVQEAIVSEIGVETQLVASNREAITRFEERIASALSRLWGASLEVSA
ncbi:MAG: N-6 DNA methylase [Fimbriimonadaceae bacterium]